MTTIQINNKTYKIPASHQEITIRQLIAVPEIIQQENLSSINKHLQIISYITQIPEGILKDTGMELIGILVNKLEWLLETDITQTQPETSFEFKGELYNVNQEFSHSAFGEYIDYDNFIRDHGPVKCIPYVLAILCKTADEKYGSYDVIKRAEAFHDLPASTALSIASFFCSEVSIRGCLQNPFHSQSLH